MAKCANCNSDFKFMNLLMSSTPWTVKCSECSEKITTQKLVTIVVVVVVFITCFAFFGFLIKAGYGFVGALISISLVALFAEVLWYLAIVKGVVPSNLKIENPSAS